MNTREETIVIPIATDMTKFFLKKDRALSILSLMGSFLKSSFFINYSPYFMYPRPESNGDLSLRRRLFYPIELQGLILNKNSVLIYMCKAVYTTLKFVSKTSIHQFINC